MAERFTAEQVLELARTMARLELERPEAEALARDMGRILEHLDALREVDVQGVSPSEEADPAPLRDDEVRPFQRLDDVLAQAPRREGTAFVVPKVLD